MNDNTYKLLDALAKKLGTTTEYLWTILLKQAPIDATITLIQVITVLLFGFTLWRVHLYLLKSADKDTYSRYDDNDAYGPIMIILTVIWVTTFIICFCNIDIIINGYFNPEYWALNKILSSVK